MKCRKAKKSLPTLRGLLLDDAAALLRNTTAFHASASGEGRMEGWKTKSND